MAKIYKNGQLLTTKGDVDSSGKALPPKTAGVDVLVRQAAQKDQILISPHADKRMSERRINTPELLQAAKVCYRDWDNDRWNEDKGGRWQYSLRGHTKDRRHITFGIELIQGILVVTAIPK